MRERAVRLVFEQQGAHESQWAAIVSIAEKMGCSAEALRKWVRHLGVAKEDLQSTIERYVNPNLVKFAEVLLEKMDKKDFVAGVVGHNLILEGMAFTVFEMLHAANAALNPKFAATLSGTIADERRRAPSRRLRQEPHRVTNQAHPERRTEFERMQKEMSHHMLATFADAFRQAGPALPAAREVTRRCGTPPPGSESSSSTRRSTSWRLRSPTPC